MSTVSIESSIGRARKVVRSKIQCVVEARIKRKSRNVSMQQQPQPSNRNDSLQRRVFDIMFARPARRTVSFIRPGQQKAAEVQGEVVKSRTLGDRFFSLPVELQLNIVNLLFFFDLLSLRKTSRDFRDLTILHESHIVRHHISMWVPKHIIKLYPPSICVPPTLNYLTDLAYKQRVSTQLAMALANQVVKEMMGSRQQRLMTKEANDYIVNQLRLGMAPLIFALFHFLETYRERKLEHLLETDCIGDEGPSTLLNPLSHEKNMALQSDILRHYPDDLLLQVHQMYHLLLHLLIRRLSPATLPFGLRTLGRWNSQRPTNQAFAKVLVLGGIREVWELYKIKGYGNRRKALEKYLKKLDSSKKQCSTPSSKRWVEGPLPVGASRSTARITPAPGRGPSLDIPAKLARLDVDELMDVWTPAAEERLLSREIVGSLDEVGCCGQFVSQLLGSMAESDNEDDGDEADSDDEDDSGDDVAGPAVGGIHYVGGTTGGEDSFWDDDLNEEEDSFGDDEGEGEF